MASSINAGSSAAATITTPVVGCWRRSMPTDAGSVFLSRMSRMTSVGLQRAGLGKRADLVELEGRRRMEHACSSSSSC